MLVSTKARTLYCVGNTKTIKNHPVWLGRIRISRENRDQFRCWAGGGGLGWGGGTCRENPNMVTQWTKISGHYTGRDPTSFTLLAPTYVAQKHTTHCCVCMATVSTWIILLKEPRDTSIMEGAAYFHGNNSYANSPQCYLSHAEYICNFSIKRHLDNKVLNSWFRHLK
jgi:hypothetical protein